MKRQEVSKKKVAMRVAAGVLALTAVSSLLAFKAMFPHSGEKALDLIPESADVVGTLDLDPSPSQALTFARIASALHKNRFASSVETAGKELDKKEPGVSAIWNLSKHSVSFCALSKPGDTSKKDEHFAILIPVTDAEKARAYLVANGKADTYQDTPFYALKSELPNAMLEGDTLILSDQSWVLHEMAKVTRGQEKPVTQVAGYAEARAQEPRDATLIVVTTPHAANMTQGLLSQRSLGWTTTSITVQSDGIAFSTNGKVQPDSDPTTASLARVKPLRSDLLQVLPAGAYAIYAQSQPGEPVFAALKSYIGTDKDAAKALTDSDKSSGLNILNDIQTAMRGDVVFASYPSQDPSAGLDFLLVLDNQNGADPASVAAKFQKYLDRTINPKEGADNRPWFTSVPRSDGVEYKLACDLEKGARSPKGLPIRSNTLLADKTVVWASINGNEFIATSQALLDRTIAAYKGNNPHPLSNDSKLVNSLKTPNGDQILAVASMPRIAEGLRNTLDDTKMSADSRRLYTMFLDALSQLDKPMQMETAVSPDGTIKANGFLPIDYVKLIDFFGASKQTYDKELNPREASMNSDESGA